MAHGGLDMGTDTMSGMPIRNVQLSTFNGVTERGHGGRDVGTGTELRRHLSLGFACLYCGFAICSVCIFLSGGVR